MRTLALLLFLCFVLQATAQRECGTHTYNSNKPSIGKKAAEAFIQQQKQNVFNVLTGTVSGANKNVVYRIPVIVHVLYNNGAQNISDEQIKSGIEALNRDFRKQNSDTVNTPAYFKHLGADVEIEFRLATADPKGAPTNGIIRRQTGVPAWNMDDKIKFTSQGGDDGWDSKSYLNIWIGNTRRLLGYATMPGEDEKLDGLVINYIAFGKINVAAPYNLGRTAVHEAGHWLGLHHIWGDEACGDDEVDDTPQQSGYTAGCPRGFRRSCSSETSGDMYMNYMDFTNDACLNLFTYGQKERMRSLFAGGGPRNSLLASKGLDTPWTEVAPITKVDTSVQILSLQLYPNPSVTELNIKIQSSESKARGELRLLNVTGIEVARIVVSSNLQKINTAHLHAGIYYLQGFIQNKKISQKFIKL